MSILYNDMIRITLVRYEIILKSQTNSCGMFKKKFGFPQIRSFCHSFINGIVQEAQRITK